MLKKRSRVTKRNSSNRVSSHVATEGVNVKSAASSNVALVFVIITPMIVLILDRMPLELCIKHLRVDGNALFVNDCHERI